MEVFGTCNENFINTNVILESTSFIDNRDRSIAFTKHGIKKHKEYPYIATETLQLIVTDLKEIYAELYEKVEEELLNPKALKTDQRFDLRYLKEYFKYLEKTVYVFCAAPMQHRLRWLDSLIYQIQEAIKNKQYGFIYVIPKDKDRIIRPIIRKVMDNNFLHIALLKNEFPDYEQWIEICKAEGLITMNGQEIILTHKAEASYQAPS